MSAEQLSLSGMRWRVLDLFAGCGGISVGLHSTGRFGTVGAIEADSDAAETYGLNLGIAPVRELIENVRVFPEADVVVGGPPCQGFSPLNRDGVGYERRALWREYLRALDDVKASVFLMENVPELLTSGEYASFRAAAEARGYLVEGRVVNMADYGVPQRRRRAIVLGSLHSPIAVPEPSHHDPTRPRLGGHPWATFRAAVEGLPLEPDGKNWHRKRNPRAESVVRYRAVPHDGGDRFAMQRVLDDAGLAQLVPRCWREKTSGTTDVFGRLWWDRPALTIRTEFYKPEKGRYLHPVADRPITVREAARLMTFPDSFRFPETQSMTSVARQIGNAVPPRMAAVLGNAIANHLSRAGPARREAA
jgi:DNA (cytosine-5)-methyltransferase 1